MHYRIPIALTVLVCAVGSCALPPKTADLTDEEQEAVLLTTLDMLRVSLTGDLVIDPNVAPYVFRLGRGTPEASWAPATAKVFAAAVGGDVAELNAVRRCIFPERGGSPYQMGCQLHGAHAHLSRSRPRGSKDRASAVVYMSADFRTAPRDHFDRVLLVRLDHHAGDWRVTETRTVAAM